MFSQAVGMSCSSHGTSSVLSNLKDQPIEASPPHLTDSRISTNAANKSVTKMVTETFQDEKKQVSGIKISWKPDTPTDEGLDVEEKKLLQTILRFEGVLTNEQKLVKRLYYKNNKSTQTANQLYGFVQEQQKEKEMMQNEQKTVIGFLEAQSNQMLAHMRDQKQRQCEYEAARERDFKSQENQRKELEALKREREQTAGVFRQVREHLLCCVCTEVAILPKVLGTCGHICCQNCLKQLDDVAFSSTNTAGASARQHLLARRCPLCRAEIVGQAFPVLPMKDVAALLIGSGHIEVADQAATQKHLDVKAITYDKESAESKHIAALQLGCYAQSQLAQHSVNGVLAKITTEQWNGGVYVLFEAAVSRVFFETFATTLHGKAGGLNVLVNASQRMLAVQLIDKSKRDEKRNEEKKGHLIVKVGTDGRFAITTTPVQSSANPSNPANPASASPAPAAVNPTSESPSVGSSTSVNPSLASNGSSITSSQSVPMN